MAAHAADISAIVGALPARPGVGQPHRPDQPADRGHPSRLGRWAVRRWTDLRSRDPSVRQSGRMYAARHICTGWLSAEFSRLSRERGPRVGQGREREQCAARRSLAPASALHPSHARRAPLCVSQPGGDAARQNTTGRALWNCPRPSASKIPWERSAQRGALTATGALRR